MLMASRAKGDGEEMERRRSVSELAMMCTASGAS